MFFHDRRRARRVERRAPLPMIQQGRAEGIAVDCFRPQSGQRSPIAQSLNM